MCGHVRSLPDCEEEDFEVEDMRSLMLEDMLPLSPLPVVLPPCVLDTLSLSPDDWTLPRGLLSDDAVLPECFRVSPVSDCDSASSKASFASEPAPDGRLCELPVSFPHVPTCDVSRNNLTEESLEQTNIPNVVDSSTKVKYLEELVAVDRNYVTHVESMYISVPDVSVDPVTYNTLRTALRLFVPAPHHEVNYPGSLQWDPLLDVTINYCLEEMWYRQCTSQTGTSRQYHFEEERFRFESWKSFSVGPETCLSALDIPPQPPANESCNVTAGEALDSLSFCDSTVRHVEAKNMDHAAKTMKDSDTDAEIALDELNVFKPLEARPLKSLLKTPVKAPPVLPDDERMGFHVTKSTNARTVVMFVILPASYRAIDTILCDAAKPLIAMLAARGFTPTDGDSLETLTTKTVKRLVQETDRALGNDKATDENWGLYGAAVALQVLHVSRPSVLNHSAQAALQVFTEAIGTQNHLLEPLLLPTKQQLTRAVRSLTLAAPKITALTNEIKAWHRLKIRKSPSHKPKILVLVDKLITSYIESLVAELSALTQFKALHLTATDEEIPLASIHDSLETHNCLILHEKCVGREFPWTVFSIVVEFCHDVHSKWQIVCQDKYVRYMSLKATLEPPPLAQTEQAPAVKTMAPPETTTLPEQLNTPTVHQTKSYTILCDVGCIVYKDNNIMEQLENKYHIHVFERHFQKESTRVLAAEDVVIDYQTAVVFCPSASLSSAVETADLIGRIVRLSAKYLSCYLLIHNVDKNSYPFSRQVYLGIATVRESLNKLASPNFNCEVLITVTSEHLVKTVNQLCESSQGTGTASWTADSTKDEENLVTCPYINAAAAQMLLALHSVDSVHLTTTADLAELFPAWSDSIKQEVLKFLHRLHPPHTNRSTSKSHCTASSDVTMRLAAPAPVTSTVTPASGRAFSKGAKKLKVSEGHSPAVASSRWSSTASQCSSDLDLSDDERDVTASWAHQRGQDFITSFTDSHTTAHLDQTVRSHPGDMDTSTRSLNSSYNPLRALDQAIKGVRSSPPKSAKKPASTSCWKPIQGPKFRKHPAHVTDTSSISEQESAMFHHGGSAMGAGGDNNLHFPPRPYPQREAGDSFTSFDGGATWPSTPGSQGDGDFSFPFMDSNFSQPHAFFNTPGNPHPPHAIFNTPGNSHPNTHNVQPGYYQPHTPTFGPEFGTPYNHRNPLGDSNFFGGPNYGTRDAVAGQQPAYRYNNATENGFHVSDQLPPVPAGWSMDSSPPLELYTQPPPGVSSGRVTRPRRDVSLTYSSVPGERQTRLTFRKSFQS